MPGELKRMSNKTYLIEEAVRFEIIKSSSKIEQKIHKRIYFWTPWTYWAVTNEERVVTQTEVSLDSQIICRVTHEAGSSIL